MKGEPDAVIGNAALGKVVGADALTSISRANEALSICRFSARGAALIVIQKAGL